MAQISLYVDDSLVGRLTAAAKTEGSSVSKYVTNLIAEDLGKKESAEIYKKHVLEQLCGVLDDPDFTIPPEISWDDEIPRRYDLI
jgi:hypothetical protein